MSTGYGVENIDKANAAAAAGDARAAYAALRAMPFSDFCELSLYVSDNHPALKTLLPGMPSIDDQKTWVGDHGRALMVRSFSTVQMFELMFLRHCRRSLDGATVLDYGVGWGRLLRLFHHKTAPEKVFGVDPMQLSLKACEDCGLTRNIALCDAVPGVLPFGKTRFDLIFSFSVLTHVPEKVALAMLKAARARVTKDGMCIVTIHADNFWELRRVSWPAEKVEELLESHRKTGYAFTPVGGGTLEREEYGDVTYSRSYFERLCEEAGWALVDVEADMTDPYQIAMVMKPK